MHQRISQRNEERFRAAKLMRPSLTFDGWVDELWSIAVGWEKATQAPRGRPSSNDPSHKEGLGRSAAVTGSILRPKLLRILLSNKNHRMPRSEVISKLEVELTTGRITNEFDFKKTSAGIPSWKHRLLSEVAQLRKRHFLEQQLAGETDWALTAKGVTFAKSLLQC